MPGESVAMWNAGGGNGGGGGGGGIGADSFSQPGLIEDDTPTLPGDKKWRRLCAYLSVLLALSVAGKRTTKNRMHELMIDERETKLEIDRVREKEKLSRNKAEIMRRQLQV